MALPPYYHRSAVAIAQALRGYDEESIRRRLEDVTVGIAFGSDAPASGEGRAMLDLLVRLLARLYPRIAVIDGSGSDYGRDLVDLAVSINPGIDVTDTGTPTITVAAGDQGPRVGSLPVFAGSDGWRGMIGTCAPLSVGRSDNPCGAGVAAALAVGNVFRHVFTPVTPLDKQASVWAIPPEMAATDLHAWLPDTTVLCGLGAVGQATAWCLSRCGLSGSLHLVDGEEIALDNLQRYVLTDTQSPGAGKTATAQRWLSGTLTVHSHPVHWAEFVQANGYSWESVLVAVDSARARRQVQAGLPAWIANAWTQPGDLGVSRHHFNNGACLSCLYLPETVGISEDAIIATALGIPEPEQVMRIRELLFRGQGAPRDLLEMVAARHPDIDLEQILRYEGRPLGDLYREGFCGGVVLPIGKVGTPRADVHVPLAHQSALAGILLAAALVSHAGDTVARRSDVLRLDVMRPLPATIDRQPLEARGDGRCICEDSDYRRRYRAKWSHSHQLAVVT